MKHTILSLFETYIIKIKDGLVFLYKFLIQAKSFDEDTRRREFILNLILLGSILLIICSNIIILTSHLGDRSTENYISLLPFSLLTLIFIILFITSRLGKITFVSYCLVILYLLGTSYGAFRWGVILPAVMLSYALLITISSILLNSRMGVIITGISMLSLLFFGYNEIQLNSLPRWRHEVLVLSDLIEYSIILLVIAIVSWLSSREIEKSLKRARSSEKELRAERDSLEVTIAERTKDLEIAQSEKMSQLYRFAEFGRLSSGLFHDLINPLTSVALNLSNIKESVHPDVRIVKEDLHRAVIASEKIDGLINVIGNQIRSEAAITLFSVEKTIRDVFKLFSHKSLVSNIPLIFSGDKDITIHGNYHKFQQIITNLISNAFDSYNQYNSLPKNLPITVHASILNNHIHITISDHGHGISEEVLPRIFDPFFSTKPTSRGMGLGLSMVKTIVTDDFNGAISVESKIQTGTTFTIIIPEHTNSV